MPCLFINLLQNIKNALWITESNDQSYLILDYEVDFIPFPFSSHLLLFNFLNELQFGDCLEHLYMNTHKGFPLSVHPLISATEPDTFQTYPGQHFRKQQADLVTTIYTVLL